MYYFVAAISSINLTVRFFIKRRVSLLVWKKYLLKSINLSLCYNEFTFKHSFAIARKAGEAGFACSAYDYVSDYINFNDLEFNLFKRTLASFCTQEVIAIVDEIYTKEDNNCLTDEGLERGALAFRFVIKHMGVESEWMTEDSSFDEVGKKLQILDDLLDYFEDQELNHTNCFLIDQLKYIDSASNVIDAVSKYKHFKEYKSSVMDKVLYLANIRQSEIKLL